MKVQNKDLTFHQLMNGLGSTIFTDMPVDEMSLELSNKLSFIQFFIEMSFHYSHKEVLDINFETIMHWQNRQVEWTEPWSHIDEGLKGIQGQFTQSHQSHTARQQSSSRAPVNPDGGAAPSHEGCSPSNNNDCPVNGVHRSFMKDNHICIPFNTFKGCDDQSSHKNKYGPETLQHICGGCLAKDESKKQHCVADCKVANFASLFPKW